jgi:hypothetical protein
MSAVNGRRHLSELSGLSKPESLYFGNLVGSCLARLPIGQLSASGSGGHPLAAVCDAISRSTSRARGGWRPYAEAQSLVDRMGDYRGIFYALDWFASRDFSLSSWANFDTYSLDFGPQLGRPEFVRMRAMEGDSCAVILPRRCWGPASASGDAEVLEIKVLLRKDDMDALEKDSLWSSLLS